MAEVTVAQSSRNFKTSVPKRDHVTVVTTVVSLSNEEDSITVQVTPLVKGIDFTPQIFKPNLRNNNQECLRLAAMPS